VIRKIGQFIEENRLLTGGDKVIAALSGGADSVALLHILISLREKYKLDIYAAHFNHMIRGEAADRDEDFARELCAGLGVDFRSGRADVPAAAAESGESLELCGRRLRYEYLQSVADELGGAAIATAHHMTDNTETVLMNLVRGSGLSGMCGIPVRRGNIIRPLLCVTREEIEDYCRLNRLDYVTDATNLDDAYTRNSLRLNVLPVLRGMNPSLDLSVGRMCEAAREADEYLEYISAEELSKCRTSVGYSCSGLLNMHTAVRSYAVRQILDEASAPVDRLHIELITEALSSSGSVDLGRGLRAVCAQGTLRIIGGEEPVNAELCVPFSRHSETPLTVERIHTPDNRIVNKKFLQNCIPCDIITDDTVIRTRRASDTFTDPRRRVTKSLKKLFNELKIPREKRDGILIIARGSTALWIEDIGAAAQAQAGEGSAELYYIHK